MTLKESKPSDFPPHFFQEGFPDFEEPYYFNARWYDANTARFITEDPIRDGLLWYSYCSNNPLKFVDPTGLAKEDRLRRRAQRAEDKGNDDRAAELRAEAVRVEAEPSVLDKIKKTISEAPPLTMGAPGSTMMYKLPEHYTALGMDYESALELAELENTANIEGTMIGTGLTLSLMTGTSGAWTTSMVSAFSSTRIAGGSNEDAVSNMSVTSLFGWIPTGTSEMSLFGEMAKNAIASAGSQVATSGEFKPGVVASYAALGLFSQLSTLHGINTADPAMKILGGQFLPIAGSSFIEYASEESE